MNFIDVFKYCVTKKFAVFRGRANCKEYWFYVLAECTILMISQTIDMFCFGAPILSAVILLVLTIPNLAAYSRRIHDIGHSLWSLVLLLVFFLGPIVLLCLLAKKGDPETNKYGPASYEIY